MKHRRPLFALLCLMVFTSLVACANAPVSPTALAIAPTATPLPTFTLTATLEPTASPTSTSSPTLTATSTSTATAPPTATKTPTVTPVPPTLNPDQQARFDLTNIATIGRYNFGNNNYLRSSNGILIPSDGTNGFHFREELGAYQVVAADIQEAVNLMLGSEGIQNVYNQVGGIDAIVDASKFGHSADPDNVGPYRIIMLDHRFYANNYTHDQKKALYIMSIAHELGRWESRNKTNSWATKSIWLDIQTKIYNLAKGLDQDPGYQQALDYMQTEISKQPF